MSTRPLKVTRSAATKVETQRPVGMALQGGGAHGAFTWGVLDRLLEDGRISIEAVSATSAGSMNAVVMAHGYSVGGREGAREKLAEFWEAVSKMGAAYGPLRRMPWERWMAAYGQRMETSMAFMAFQALTHLFSPDQLNPFNFNPLRDVLMRVVDFAHLSQCPRTMRLYLSATNVRTGKVKVFENGDLTVDAVLASACLPYIFRSVEIDGEYYWDGGYMGNPAIFPLIYRQGTRDVVIVHVNPLERPKIPRSAPEIFDRVNEISFNSSLMREMRAIAFVTKLIDEGALDSKRYARMLIHSIKDDALMNELGVATKLNPEWQFLCRLRDAGRAQAERWLDANYTRLGQQSTIDLTADYM